MGLWSGGCRTRGRHRKRDVGSFLGMFFRRAPKAAGNRPRRQVACIVVVFDVRHTSQEYAAAKVLARQLQTWLLHFTR